MGFAFLTFCNATLESGIKIILEETHLEKYIRDADVVITGEGRLDGQTVMGKAPIGVVDGKEVKMEVSVGQKVIYSKYAGTEVKLDGEEYIIVRQNDILAVVE